MAKKIKQASFDEVLSKLGNEHFDVAPAHEGAGRGTGRMYRVTKYGCAAEIGENTAETTDRGGAGTTAVRLLSRPGWLLGGEIARILDRGYQKFLATSKLQVPATADHLRDIHRFSEELKEAIGQLVLYNEAMGTTSDVYLYDRVKGRE